MIHHLAEFNVATMKAPLDHPQMAEFVRQIVPINALADASPGVVWRLQTEEGNSTAIRAFEDERIMVNLSVWESVASLRAFVFSTDHVRLLRERGE